MNKILLFYKLRKITNKYKYLDFEEAISKFEEYENLFMNLDKYLSDDEINFVQSKGLDYVLYNFDLYLGGKNFIEHIKNDYICSNL